MTSVVTTRDPWLDLIDGRVLKDPACRQARRERGGAASPPLRRDAVDHLDHPAPTIAKADNANEIPALRDSKQ
jgi:hypothetical protein